jgi:hypothetical protein
MPAKKKASKKKAKAKSKVKAAPKKKKAEPLKPWDLYRVEMEQMNDSGYGFVPADPANLELEEPKAQAKADELKMLGVGGRLILLDGTPDGTVTESWGGVGKVLAASAVEKAALKN